MAEGLLIDVGMAEPNRPSRRRRELSRLDDAMEKVKAALGKLLIKNKGQKWRCRDDLPNTAISLFFINRAVSSRERACFWDSHLGDCACQRTVRC